MNFENNLEDMYIKHLSLTNFRNYIRLELDLPSQLTLIQGDNAQGKTNLLEAIYFLATTRPLHARTDSQLINWSAQREEMPFARLAADIQRRDAPHRIEIALIKMPMPEAARLHKRIKVDGVERRALDLIGQVNVVIFSPQDLDLISGPPQVRRHYLNATICQIDPHYCRALNRYNHILKQRNYLLRRLQERRGDPDQLSFWDKGLIEEGIYLIAQRQEILTELNELIHGIHLRLTGEQERLHLIYQPSVKVTADQRITEAFAAQLSQVRAKEMQQGLSLLGPHRDDMCFLVDGVDMNLYASRGQRRTIALSLRLAEMELMRGRTGEQPILLLDDVMSELDHDRRQHLMATISGDQQAIITTTDLDRFAPDFLARLRLLMVREGKIEAMTNGQSGLQIADCNL